MNEKGEEIKKLRQIIHKIAEDLTDEIFVDICNNGIEETNNNGMAYESIKNGIKFELEGLCEDTGDNEFLALLLKTKGIVAGIDD